MPWLWQSASCMFRTQYVDQYYTRHRSNPRVNKWSKARGLLCTWVFIHLWSKVARNLQNIGDAKHLLKERYKIVLLEKY